MNLILSFLSCVITTFCGIWRNAIAPTTNLTVNQTSPTVNDVMDIPRGLLIGTAVSAYQNEGAWNISDKGESSQDYKSHNFLRKFNATGDVTTDFYHKYREDIQLLKNIGFDIFRFSISWSRLLPNGTPDYVSEDGLHFYNNILDELEKKGIEPFVTLYHWDHLAKYEKEGAWLNENIAYRFADYARVVFREFGNRVKYFATMNEPEVYCRNFRPLKNSPYGKLPLNASRYICHQNMLKGHALAYHIYNDEFRDQQNGQVGIISLCESFYSKDEKDRKAQEIAHAFNCGSTANPIFSEEGDYPEIMKTRIAEISRLQGLNKSRLPELSDKWIKFIKNSSDFYGLNHYGSFQTEQLPISEYNLWPNDEGIKYSSDPKWLETKEMNIHPQGFGDVLRKIKNEYNNIPVFVLENGVPSKNHINDDFRIKFYHSYLKEMLIAIKEDKCNVRMYTLWSFLDSFEWIDGYGLTFGIVQVDFDDSNLKRMPKKSALWFKQILASRQLLPPDVINSGLNFI